jgi:hypothetical protein
VAAAESVAGSRSEDAEEWRWGWLVGQPYIIPPTNPATQPASIRNSSSVATKFKPNRTIGHMKTPKRKPCAACLRRRAKIKKLLRVFKKGTRK